MITLPAVRVGEPIGYEAVSIFPLLSEEESKVNYLLSDEALAAGNVTVEEIGEGGSVPELIVKNQTEGLVLFLEGEELRGAKQNRVLNTSVLVAAKSSVKIPVSCVEQGRWRYVSRHFASSGSHSSPKLRHILNKSVLRSAKEGRGHRSDQGEVWQEVGRQASSLGVHSDSGAMADTYDAFEKHLDEFRQRLHYVEGAIGMVVAVGNKVASLDLFDKPSTCRKVWERLLTGVTMSALEAGSEQKPMDKAEAENFLSALRSLPWEQTQAVGTGQEYRAAGADDRHASALVCEDTVVHGSVVMA